MNFIWQALLVQDQAIISRENKVELKNRAFSFLIEDTFLTNILILPLTKKSNVKVLKLYFGTYVENTKNKEEGTWVINDQNFENIIKNFKPIISNFDLVLGIWKKQEIMLTSFKNLLLRIKNYLLFTSKETMLIKNIVL